ncbi:MAG TPA: hypothetical protein VK947_04200 [Planococcus sp. (in: firmicutes)]|nr:hypothetical protein [Planococcus sp. (in: firmicutes)]
MHDEVVEVPVESWKVHDRKGKEPVKKFLSASLLGGASMPALLGLSYRSSTP